MGFKPRNTLNDMFELEIDMKVGKKQLGQIVDMCFRKHGVSETARVLDNVKAMGYKYSTIGAVTVAVADVIVPPEKKPILEASEKKVRAIEKQFKRGLLTDEERYERVVEVWSKTTDDVKSKIMDYMDEFNPIRMMTDSGARGSISQVSQLAGMRGMMASPTGRPLEMPVKANFREGLTVLEFFQSSTAAARRCPTRCARRDSGYLTRRLVDVSQEVIIREQGLLRQPPREDPRHHRDRDRLRARSDREADRPHCRPCGGRRRHQPADGRGHRAGATR